MAISDAILGKALRTQDEQEQKIGPIMGVPVLGLDALSSAAYGPEAALTVLLPLGIVGLHFIGPITVSILLLLFVLYLSYRQVITAYPTGGGAYTVARENIGVSAALLAAAALMLDYLLNVAVGIAAGVGALVSAVPALHPHILAICLTILALITLINLRGARDSGWSFALPTYLFVVTLIATLAIGVVKSIAAGGHPIPIVMPPAAPKALQAVSLWLILKAFSSGCTAMTGVEAISNGVNAFAEPADRKAKATLTAIIAILGVTLAAISYLCGTYHIAATDPNSRQYQSVLSMLIGAIVGRGIFYYVTIGSILVVLSLSANTSFAGFPRLCQVIAKDSYLPPAFADLGRRLVYSSGIAILAVLSAVLLISFGGITDRLIPLFAIGALGAFTLSQSGMVMHWRKVLRERGSRDHEAKVSPGKARLALVINAVGGVATFAALLIVLVTKFAAGAWIVLLLIPTLLVAFHKIHAHYAHVGRAVDSPTPLDLQDLRAPVVVVPFKCWDDVAKKALKFALTMSADVIAVHVEVEAEHSKLQEQWKRNVEEPAKVACGAVPQLKILDSPYRVLAKPLIGCVDEVKRDYPDRLVAVIIPELVQRKWYEILLHRQRATLLKAALLFQGDERVVVINVPRYVD